MFSNAPFHPVVARILADVDPTVGLTTERFDVYDRAVATTMQGEHVGAQLMVLARRHGSTSKPFAQLTDLAARALGRHSVKALRAVLGG